jgi:hypothetical protein
MGRQRRYSITASASRQTFKPRVSSRGLALSRSYGFSARTFGSQQLQYCRAHALIASQPTSSKSLTWLSTAGEATAEVRHGHLVAGLGYRGSPPVANRRAVCLTRHHRPSPCQDGQRQGATWLRARRVHGLTSRGQGGVHGALHASRCASQVSFRQGLGPGHQIRRCSHPERRPELVEG